MNADALRELLALRPFTPIEIQLSSGQTLTIRHPENVLVLKSTLVIADPEKDLVNWCSLIHITNVARKGSNGRQPKR